MDAAAQDTCGGRRSGDGVADDKAMYCYVSDLIAYY